MRKHIDLSEEKLKSIKPDDIIAITLAAGGAMGDPSAIELVDKKLRVYYTHFGEIDNSKLKKVIPFLDTLRVAFDDIEGVGDDWVGLYAGYGNYLFVRPELKEPILRFVEDNYGDSKLSLTVELYSHWYDALEAVKNN